jgi:cytochrome c peroxidase
MIRILPFVSTAAILLLATSGILASWGQTETWTEEERQRIASLSLSTLPDLPPDPTNAVADDPAAAALGRELFFDTRLSANGEVSCASCHLPDRHFQDSAPSGRGIGETTRRTMPIAGTAYSPFLFWDGRADSLWAQALGPLEHPSEHGSNRADIVALLATSYREAFIQLFGNAPNDMPVDVAFANVGKAIAAFERTILPQPSRFDDYADAIALGERSDALDEQEINGLRLFIGDAGCLNCHNGPLLTDNDFHNTGVPAVSSLPPDMGRAEGVLVVRSDPFNCLGAFSDATAEDCAELNFMKASGDELIRAYKTPSLRNVSQRAPFMHAGQIQSLADVVAHYSSAPPAPAGQSELDTLHLTAEEQLALIAFLMALDGKPDQRSDE